MSLQYISDSNGVPTGVFIPLSEWENLKNKYNDLEKDLSKKETLSPELKKALDKGFNDVKEGHVKSHEEVMKQAKLKFPNLYK